MIITSFGSSTSEVLEELSFSPSFSIPLFSSSISMRESHWLGVNGSCSVS